MTKTYNDKKREITKKVSDIAIELSKSIQYIMFPIVLPPSLIKKICIRFYENLNAETVHSGRVSDWEVVGSNPTAGVSRLDFSSREEISMVFFGRKC